MKSEIKQALTEMLLSNEHVKQVYDEGIAILEIDTDKFPLVIMGVTEGAKERFLFSECELSVTLVVGYNSDGDKAHDKGIELKDSIRTTLKTDPLLKGTVSYSTVIGSKTEKPVSKTIYTKEIVMYINYRD